MKRHLLSFFALSLLWLTGYSQSYYFIYKTGTMPPYEYNETEDAYDIMPVGSTNDQLSSWQTLPFTWNFFGSPVTGYYASDNGYITFDPTATTSDPNNTTIPNVAGPNQAIYAFWDDLSYGPSGRVRAFDYGVSPNRIHAIQWYGMQRTGSAATIYATLRLHESGAFDVIFDLSQGGSSLVTNGTVGAENLAGTAGHNVQSAPNTQFPDITADNQDDHVFHYQYGNQYQRDLSVLDINMKPTVAAGNYMLQGTIKNLGSMSITTFRLNYQLNNDPVQSTNLNTLTLTANGGEYAFFTTSTVNLPTAGQFYDLKVWCDNLSGQPDQNNENDTLDMNIVTVLGNNAPKKVLIEKFTATWCGACPVGLEYMDTCYANFPNQVIGIANHASDAFSFTNQMFDFYGVSGIPDGMVDRIGSNFGADPLTYPTSWPARVANRLNEPVPVEVDIFSVYNPSNGQVTGQAVARFVDYAAGDLRLVLFVTEDGLSGNQAGLGPVVYDHILRAMPLGEWGTPGTIPSLATPGNDYVENFSFTIPSSWNTANMKLVGAVVRYDISKRKHEVINADDAPLDNGVSAEAPVAESRSLGVSPNPVNGLASVQVEFAKNATARFTLHDAFGREVSVLKDGRFTSGKHAVWFDVSAVPAGVYFLKVSSDQGNFTEKVIVQH